MRLCFLGLLFLPACAPRRTQVPEQLARVDSIVLERTLCLGTCPAYRLSVQRDGVVHFQSRNPGDSVGALDTIGSSAVGVLAQRAYNISFWNLPDTISKDLLLCEVSATDLPAIIVGIFGSHSKRVVYYTGCLRGCCQNSPAPILSDLQAFASAIDSAVNAARWIRAARLR